MHTESRGRTSLSTDSRRRRRRSSRPVAAAVAVAAVAATAPVGLAHAAPTDVVINELMYHALSDLDGDDYVELHNRGTTAQDLSGWTMSGVTITLPAGTSIAAGGYLVLARDAAVFQGTYGFAPAGVYTGNLSNSGETVALKDATGATIDAVPYGQSDPWPTSTDGLGPSLELIDPALDNADPLDWAASTAASGGTPRAANSVRSTGLGPRITAVSASPVEPAANQPVTVSATVTGHTGAPVLRWRSDFGAEQTATMQAGVGGAFTATLPGVAAGHLLRYRVEATNAVRTTRFPRIDDSEVYKGVVAANGVTSNLPIFDWFIADADYTAITSQPEEDIERRAVLAYDGIVYDNVLVNIRGQGSQSTPKVNWKFEMAQNHPLVMPGLLVEPVDEFAMQADWSDTAHGRPLLSWDAFQQAGVVTTQIFPVRTQRNAQFQGIYSYLDLFDGTWREREGYDADQFFKANINAFDASVPLEERRFEKKNPADGDFAPLRELLSGITLTGTAQRSYMLGNTDIPQLIDYAAVTAILDHVDSSTKNFYVARDAESGRWEMLPWDLDHTLGNHCCFVESDFVTPAEAGDRTNDIMDALFAQPEWRQMYFRRLRTLVDRILAPGRLEALYDAEVGPAQPEIVLDFARYPYKPSMTYANQRANLFNAIAERRTVFASDPRVPAAQPAAPSIVIHEIQHSPTGGAAAQFLELHNPGSTAVDLSDWTVSGAVDLTVQPGTVVLPGSTMTFVADDPTFRATYGSSVFVGGRYDGELPPSGTLWLARADGTPADVVAYGGAGWPQTTDGRSLSLTDPASDNSLPGSWAPSSAPGGTPGAANGGVVASPPGAPTIGTPTAGNASATVRWTAPASDGGSPVTGYQVRVLDAAGAQVGALRPAAAGTTSLVVTGLSNGTAYRFQVAAVNAVGAGALSAVSVAVTPTAGPGAPGAPVIGAPSQGAAGGALTATARWTPPSSTGGSPITGYQVTALRMSSSAADATVISTTTDRVLGPGVRQRSLTLAAGNYRFQVVAVNAAGTSPPSARSSNVVPR